MKVLLDDGLRTLDRITQNNSRVVKSSSSSAWVGTRSVYSIPPPTLPNTTCLSYLLCWNTCACITQSPLTCVRCYNPRTPLCTQITS